MGLLLIAGIIFLIVANPLAKLSEFGGPPGGGSGGFGQQGPAPDGEGQGGGPSEEMMKEFMQKGGPPR